MSRVTAVSLGKMPTTSLRRFNSLLSRSSGLVLHSWARCWRGEVHVGEHVGLRLVHQRGKLRYAGPRLIGDLAPLTPCGLGGSVSAKAVPIHAATMRR